jgi:hypothetical protein
MRPDQRAALTPRQLEAWISRRAPAARAIPPTLLVAVSLTAVVHAR